MSAGTDPARHEVAASASAATSAVPALYFVDPGDQIMTRVLCLDHWQVLYPESPRAVVTEAELRQAALYGDSIRCEVCP